MRTFFWASDAGASGWYRMLLPSQSLKWLPGHDTAANTAINEAWREAVTCVVGARTCQPGPTKAWREFRDRGVRLVVDMDDDYWHLDPTNPARQVWSAEMLARLEANMAGSDIVTAASTRLAEEIRQHTDTPVVVIPNGLEAQLLGEVRVYDRPRVRVGWAGTSSTVYELPLAARALRRIADYPQVDVRLVGIPPVQAAAAGAGHEHVKTLGWLDTPGKYLEGVASFDVWVAPYRDTPFNRAKFPTKALEAGFLGIPLIASNVGAYAEAVEHGVTGFLVDHDHEWGRYLKMLVGEPELRRQMGLAARAKASASILQCLNQQWAAVVAPGRTTP